MKTICLILPKSPYPLKDGGQKALDASVRLWLKAGFQLRIVVFSTPKHPWHSDNIPEDLRQRATISWLPVQVDTSLRPFHVFYALKHRLGLRAARFFSKDVLELLEKFLDENEPEFIVWESPFTALYIPFLKKRKSRHWYRAHNVEFQIWKGQGSGLRSLLMRLDNPLLKVLEMRIWKMAELILAISPEDMQYIAAFTGAEKVKCLPMQVETGPLIPQVPSEPPHLYHLGAMDWLPNLQGIQWFLKQIWPEFHRKFPDINLHLAGRHFPQNTGWDKMEGVSIHGEISEPEEILSKASVLVVPLFQGGGLRIKILEALAAGKAVIGTDRALEGLPEFVKKQCYRTDETPASWILAWETLMNDGLRPSLYQETVTREFSSEKLASRLNDWTDSM